MRLLIAGRSAVWNWGRAALAGLALLGLLGCGGAEQASEPEPAPEPAASIDSGTYPFREAARESGVDFTYYNGMTGAFYFCEIIGGGGALFDYDGDGDLDLYLTQAHLIGEGKTWADAPFRPEDDGPLRDRLFRNDLAVNADGERTLRLTDVTEESGIDARGYGMGAAVGDYNNDGWPDLYVANHKANQLWRNNGDGTFADVTAATGADDPRWSVSVSFADYDGDGWLDLFISNYAVYSVETDIACFDTVRDYCNPLTYPAAPDKLLRNNGDGTFADVSESSGIAAHFGRALGVVAADFNGDAQTDFYVANDGSANQLWINRGDGTFEETALLAGCALNETGLPEAGMGVDAGDFDADGDEDLFITHLVGQTNTIYVNDGTGVFEDQTTLKGLGPPSQPYTGFGTAWIDYDNDGWLDLLAVNGAVTKLDSLLRQGDPFPFHQINQLFHNLGDGRFEDVTAQAGPAFALSEVSRGAMFGDLDNDGDLDVVISNINGPARILINQVGADNPWIGLRLVDPALKRDAIGARVAVYRENGPPLWRRARADGSYASANDPRVLIGLGPDAALMKVRVLWLDGTVEEWTDVPIGQWTVLTKGQGGKAATP